MSRPNRFVYVLKNEEQPASYYTGITCDVEQRLAQHNRGESHHTSGAGPWRVDVVIEFADEARAAKMERYLKSGSGRAFAQRHLR